MDNETYDDLLEIPDDWRQGPPPSPLPIRVPRKKFKVHARRLHPIIKKIRRATKPYRSLVPRPSLNPPRKIRLVRRALLRVEGLLQVERVVALHELFRKFEDSANVILKAVWKDGPWWSRKIEMHNIKWYLTLSTIFNEYIHAKHRIDCSFANCIYTRKLRTISQICGMVQCDPGITRRSQQLFEQFFEVHGMPNEAELHLLSHYTRTHAETIKMWCKQCLHVQRVYAH